jgi:hypothetical protein
MPMRPRNEIKALSLAPGMPDSNDPPANWTDIDLASPSDWDFDDVPDDEIIACCIWEYARESKTIAMAADLRWCDTRHVWHRGDYKRDPALGKRHDEEAAYIEKRAKRERFDYDSFSERFWKTDYPLLTIYDSITRFVGDGAHPWQRLPRNVRDQLSKQVTSSILLRPLNVATAGELEELWKANSVYLAKVRSTVRPKNDDSEDAALWEETNAVEPFALEKGALKERITAALTVDFSRFTDQEICDAFRAWLIKTRLKRWKRPRRIFLGARQKGHKLIEYRVAVERLGLMRLLHFHTPTQLREGLPNAWKKYRVKEPSFRREIREARKFFRKLFPFLPAQERPVSEERVGIWFPPIRRYMDEMDRQNGLSRGRK